MQYQFENTEHGVALSGELTIYTAGEIKQRFSEILEKRSDLEVNLANVAEIDTAGLQMMLLLKRKAGANVCFVLHSTAVSSLINLANLGSALGDPILVGARNREESK